MTAGNYAGPGGLAVDNFGNLFVSDPFCGSIHAYDRDGMSSYIRSANLVRSTASFIFLVDSGSTNIIRFMSQTRRMGVCRCSNYTLTRRQHTENVNVFGASPFRRRLNFLRDSVTEVFVPYPEGQAATADVRHMSKLCIRFRSRPNNSLCIRPHPHRRVFLRAIAVRKLLSPCLPPWLRIQLPLIFAPRSMKYSWRWLRRMLPANRYRI